MKVNNIDYATRILIIAASVIITCVIVWLGFSAMNTAKDISNNSISQMIKLNNDLKESDINMYDSTIVTGSEIVNFIKKNLGDYGAAENGPFTVTIVTNMGTSSYTNGSYISNIRDFTDSQYIKPTAEFTGEVIRNENDVITQVIFSAK